MWIPRCLRSTMHFLSGIAVGLNLSIAGYAVASEVMANLSHQPIFVDGEQVEMTAYSINGNNYVRLRDIGKEVGFNVSWNYDESRVDIDSDSPYIADDLGEVAPPTTNTTVAEMLTVAEKPSTANKDKYTLSIENQTQSGKLSNGEAVTQDNILAMIDEVFAIFPDGTSWGDGKNGDLYLYGNGGGCNSFAWMTRDLLYGTECTATNTHQDLSSVRVGDIVHLKNNATGSEHWIVVTGTALNHELLGLEMQYVDGNSGGKVHQGTRTIAGAINNYPNSTVYCYH